MFKKTMMAAAVALTIASPAHALVKVSNFDWTTPFGTFNNLKSFTVSGIGATVSQEVGSGGTPFVNAEFSEFGASYSVNGTNTSGFPVSFGSSTIWMTFSGLSGHVSSLNSNGSFNYIFNPTGIISVSYGSTPGEHAWFDLPVAGINGSVAASIGNQVSGTSEILGLITTDTTKTSFADENNNPLNWFQQLGGLFFDVSTTNTILDVVGYQTCSFDASKTCQVMDVMSTGNAYLYRVPEPASLALVGLGLLGAGVVRRRKVIAK